ncbi:MAG TPA: TIGR03013 family XrtA/PEP-CTERM system glycosyltransferase [Rhizomicrobium sp.]|nr:TIGR03013 family XrtA/PEP-CTERM system glycosyltransferase [Rhizomicrobium sp.]
MTASTALFLIDALLVAIAWPPIVAIVGAQTPHLWWQCALFATLDLLFLYALGLYRRESLTETGKALSRIPLVVGISVVGSSFLTAALGWGLSPALFFAAALTFAACAMLTRLAFRQLRRRAIFRPHLLVIGAGKRAWDLMWILRQQGRYLAYDVTFVHNDIYGAADPRLAADPANRILKSSGGDLLDIAKRTRTDQIVVAPDERRGMGLEELINCRTKGYPVAQYMSFLEQEVRRIDIKRLDLAWVLYSDGFYVGPLHRLFKRMLDIAVSLLILAVFLPALLLAMFAVWAGDRHSPFYRQERVTRGGRAFMILKLRSMRIDAEKNGAVWAAQNDNRITPVGEFLRRSRIDELPQLINVLKGDMSLVGPRPERPQFVAELAKELPLYSERHAVKAGLTGWAQVNYPYGASLDDARSKLSYDLYYVKNVSIFFDILIIMQTLRVVIWPGTDVR